MALITCAECGRAVSNKAAVCIGCGAPLNAPSAIDLVPRPSKAPPPTRGQIKRRALLSLSLLAAGIIGAGILDHRPAGTRLPLFICAMFIIGGLCWLMVTLVHAVASRK